MKSYKYIFLTIFSASLLIVSFPTANLWGLAWIALVPFFIAIRNKNFANTFLLGLLWGLVFFYGTIYWLNSIAVAATITLVFYLALYFAFFALFARLVIRKNVPVFSEAVLAASGWVALEFLRANLFTGFGWVLLGYSHASFSPAIQIADIAGAYGVSFLIVFVNVCIYEFFFQAGETHHEGGLVKNRLLNLIFSILLVASVFIYGFYKMGNSGGHVPCGVRISLIQGNIPQSLKWDRSFRQQIIDTYFNLTKAAAADKPNIIIWPESSFPADLSLAAPRMGKRLGTTSLPVVVSSQSEPELTKPLLQLAESAGTYLLFGANRFEAEETCNSAFLVGPDGEIKANYDKLHLVPFGEYVPNIPRPLFKILPEKINMVGDFSPGKECTVFKLRITNYELPITFSVLICFEDIFPELSRRFVKNGAQFLVNITNDGWYGISSAPFQHSQASVFRAVENRVPVVRSANTGVSIFIDEKGRAFDGIEPFVSGYRTKQVSVNINPTLTFYNRYGDIFAIICLLIFIVCISCNFLWYRKV